MLKNIIQLRIIHVIYSTLRTVSSAVKTAITCDKQEISKKLVRDIFFPFATVQDYPT